MKTLKEVADKISNWIDKNGKDKFHLSHFTDILKEYDGTDWKQCPNQITCSEYKRNVQNINNKYSNTVFDIIILVWGPNCNTPIHDHPDTGCIYKVLEGKLREDIYDTGSMMNIPIKSTKLNVGDVGYIDDNVGLHKITNISDKKSVSVHIYETGYSPTCFDDIELDCVETVRLLSKI